MTTWRLAYTTALERLDADRIADALAEDVVIRVAVHDAPMHGKETARFLFGILGEELGAIQPHEELIEGPRAVVLFETSIGAVPAQGLNVLRVDEGGAIHDLTVFFRPLEALQHIADVIGPRMAARFGPAPR
jgi:hypothetical protein